VITRVRQENYQKWFTFNLAVIELPASILGPEAKMFWQYLFSRPQGWEYNRQAAINLLGSGHKVDKATAELKAVELLEIVKIRTGGKFVGYDWIVKAEPVIPDQQVSPYPDNQDTVDGDSNSPYPDIPDPVTPDPVIQDTLKEKTPTAEQTLKTEQGASFENSVCGEKKTPAIQDISDPPKNKADAAIQRLMALGFGDMEAERIYNRYREQTLIQLDWLPHRNPENPKRILTLALAQNWEAPKAWSEKQSESKTKDAATKTSQELNKWREADEQAKAEREDPEARARAKAEIERIKAMRGAAA
jgi:hypothetical protein